MRFRSRRGGRAGRRPPGAREALRAGFGTFIGFVLGTIVRYALVALMIGVAVAAYLFFPARSVGLG